MLMVTTAFASEQKKATCSRQQSRYARGDAHIATGGRILQHVHTRVRETTVLLNFGRC
jgi:hypothetical protein